MLGVFVAGTHPPRTCISGSFESMRWKACVHRLDLGLYSRPKEFEGNGVRTHVNSQGKIPSTGKILPRGASNPRRCTKDSEPNTPSTELFRPPCLHDDFSVILCHVRSSHNLYLWRMVNSGFDEDMSAVHCIATRVSYKTDLLGLQVSRIRQSNQCFRTHGESFLNKQTNSQTNKSTDK